jgi:hypothetical protein
LKKINKDLTTEMEMKVTARRSGKKKKTNAYWSVLVC